MDYARPDGRLPNELRDIVISFDGLSGVDGSARFGFGQTKALASVSGPIEVRLAVEQASKATFEVIARPLAGLPGTESKALASSLRIALLPSIILTNNPRTLVQLVAQSLTPSTTTTTTNRSGQLGSANSKPFRTSPALVAAHINAASLALLNASSIPLRGVVCSASFGRVRRNPDNDTDSALLVVDPSEDELHSLDGIGAFAFLISEESKQARPDPLEQSNGIVVKAELVWSNWTVTPFDEDELARATELARVGALRVREHFKEAIAQSLLGTRTDKVKVKGEHADLTTETLDDEKMEIS